MTDNESDKIKMQLYEDLVEKEQKIEKLQRENDDLKDQMVKLKETKESQIQEISATIRFLLGEMTTMDAKHSAELKELESRMREEFTEKLDKNEKEVEKVEERIQNELTEKATIQQFALDDIANKLQSEMKDHIDSLFDSFPILTNLLLKLLSDQENLLSQFEEFKAKSESKISTLKKNVVRLLMWQNIIDIEKGLVNKTLEKEIDQFYEKNNQEISSVLIFGGVGKGVSDAIYIFNQMTKRFTLLNKFTMPQRDCGYGVCWSKTNCRVMMNPSAIWDKDNPNWIFPDKISNQKRTAISNSCAVFQDKVFVMGGFDLSGRALKSVECFDTTANTFTNLPEMNRRRANAAVAVLDGKLYVSGGMNGRAFDNTIEVFDSEAKWKHFCFLPDKIGLAAHCMLASYPYLIILGGVGESGVTNRVHFLDITKEEIHWKKLPSFNVKRQCFGAFNLLNSIFIMGGIDENNRRLDSMEIWCEGRWTAGPRLPTPLSEFAYTLIPRIAEKTFLNLK